MTTLPESPSPDRRQVAVIDVGASAIRLDIAEIGSGGSLRILESLQKPVNLGKDTFTDGRIDSASIEACVDIFRDFRAVTREYGITSQEQIHAVATSSVREADNRDVFLDRIYIATGINVEMLEDPEVEHLIHLTLQNLLASHPELRSMNLLVAEVGGGTTRLLLVQDGYVTYSGSFRLGSLRMRETLATYQTPPDRLCALLDQHILRTIHQIRQSVPIEQIPILVALAGDTESSMGRLIPGFRENHMARLSMKGPSLAEKIVSRPVDELMVHYHLPSQEAETAGNALLTLDRIARAFSAEEVMVTDLSLRRGLLLRLAGGTSGHDQLSEQLAFAATALGRKYRFDEKHSQYVAELSVRLFRTLQSDHALSPRYEALLRAAAILHDIGSFVGVGSHHKHSMYLILNSELFSLTRRDTTIVALIARYHRRAMPLPSHPEYMTLDRESRIVVLKLAALLRIADALDRSHTQKYRDLVFTREDRHFIIAATDVEDIAIERAALRDKGTMFTSVYGMTAVLRSALTLKGTSPHE